MIARKGRVLDYRTQNGAADSDSMHFQVAGLPQPFEVDWQQDDVCYQQVVLTGQLLNLADSVQNLASSLQGHQQPES